MNLKQCPFDGGTPVRRSYKPHSMYWVVCSTCFCETDCYKTPEDADCAWNSRSKEDL